MWMRIAPSHPICRGARPCGRDVWLIEGETYLSDIGTTVVESDGEKRLGLENACLVLARGATILVTWQSRRA